MSRRSAGQSTTTTLELLVGVGGDGWERSGADRPAGKAAVADAVNCEVAALNLAIPFFTDPFGAYIELIEWPDAG